MAIYYVWSAAAGTGTGANWANAFTTLTLAFATEAAGDTLYVAHDHAESTAAAITLTSSGTTGNPTKIICVDRAGTVPPVSADRRATAQVTTTGTSAISLNGTAHYDGIIFTAGTGSAATAHLNVVVLGTGPWARFDNCSLRLGGTGGSSRIMLCDQQPAAYVEMNNTTVSFAAALQGIDATNIVRWNKTPSAVLGTIPTALFLPGNSKLGHIECNGVDMSALGSGKTIVSAPSTTSCNVFKFTDCKLDAAATKSAVPSGVGSCEVDFVRCDSSATNYAVYRQRYSGSLVHELTIVRTGGASDGITPISWKVVTTAGCTFSMPFECPPIAIWNDTTGSAVTATVEGIGAALPTDAEVWVEVEYLGDASSPQGSFVNDGKANLIIAAANQTSSTEIWGGSTTAFKLAVSFTAQQKGWIYARVKVGKASSTFYIDPLVTLT